MAEDKNATATDKASQPAVSKTDTKAAQTASALDGPTKDSKDASPASPVTDATAKPAADPANPSSPDASEQANKTSDEKKAEAVAAGVAVTSAPQTDNEILNPDPEAAVHAAQTVPDPNADEDERELPDFKDPITRREIVEKVRDGWPRKFKLVTGKHEVINPDGSRDIKTPGDIVSLTKEAFQRFGDKFQAIIHDIEDDL